MRKIENINRCHRSMFFRFILTRTIKLKLMFSLRQLFFLSYVVYSLCVTLLQLMSRSLGSIYVLQYYDILSYSS